MEEDNVSLPDLDSIDSDLNALKTKLNGFQFNNRIFNRQTDATPYNADPLPEEAFDYLYDKRISSAFRPTLEITLGTSQLPRFCCACHKMNLVVRKAIEENKQLLNIVKALSASNSYIRNNVSLARTFRDKQASLRIENLTRWSSTYLMLESVKRAYDR